MTRYQRSQQPPLKHQTPRSERLHRRRGVSRRVAQPEFMFEFGNDDAPWQGDRFFVIVPERDAEDSKQRLEEMLEGLIPPPIIAEAQIESEGRQIHFLGIENIGLYDPDNIRDRIKKVLVPGVVQVGRGVLPEEIEEYVQDANIKPHLISMERQSVIYPAFSALAVLLRAMSEKGGWKKLLKDDDARMQITPSDEGDLYVINIPDNAVRDSIIATLREQGLEKQDIVTPANGSLLIKHQGIIRHNGQLATKFEMLAAQMDRAADARGA
jgi:hypothetical protein